MTTGAGAAGTNGFLFCDLRGYTAFVERHGDQAAAELLATYRALVRTAIAAHAGAEIKTEGDSVYVVFPAASAAVEAGLAIVAAAAEASTKDAPIRVGVGIHAGETVATTEGLVGGAVNIAARVCAKAQAGEVLVTDTVRALTRTYLPYRYTGLGTQQLKGISGGIPLYRVEAVPSSGRARLARQLGARRGRVLVLGGLVVVLLAVAGGAYALNRPVDCLNLSASTKDVVVKIDPARNCVVAVYPVGQRPAAIGAGASAVWIANLDDWTATRIDPVTGLTRTTGTVGSPTDLILDPAGQPVVLIRLRGNGTDFHNDWIAVIDPRTNQISELRTLPGGTVNSILGPPAYAAMTYSAGRAWISDTSDGLIVRVALGPAGPGFVTIPVEAEDVNGAAGTGPIDAGGGAVWLANSSTPQLYRLEGVKASAIDLQGDGGTTSIDATDSEVWLARGAGRVTRYDPLTGAQASLTVDGSISIIAASRDSLWAADGLARRVLRVHPDTGKTLATVPVGGRPSGMAIAPDGSIWVTIQAP